MYSVNTLKAKIYLYLLNDAYSDNEALKTYINYNLAYKKSFQRVF